MSALPVVGKLTVEDYYRLAEEGVIPPDARVELIHGEIVEMSPMGARHAAMVRRLERLASRRLGDRATVSGQLPVRIGVGQEPVPDLCIAKHRADDYCRAHPTPADAYLLIEVADSSLAFDREVKGPLYAAAGVPEYWIVNLLDRTIEKYLGPTAAGYGPPRVFLVGSTVTADAIDFSVAVAELFEDEPAQEK